MTNFTPFDVADYLDNEETIAAYLTGALVKRTVKRGQIYFLLEGRFDVW